MKAFLPGTFDPPTMGHIDLITRASRLCSQLVIGVGVNLQKKIIFSAEERVALLKNLVHQSNITFVIYHELTTDFMQKHELQCIIRGMRNANDLNDEYLLCFANKKLDPLIETIYLLSDPKYLHISSSLIKEIAHFGHRLHQFVPDEIEQIVFSRLKIIQDL